MICRMLGYDNLTIDHTGKIHIFILRFPGAKGFTHRDKVAAKNFLMDNVGCVGDEASILDCSYSTTHNCGETEGAGVICQEP